MLINEHKFDVVTKKGAYFLWDLAPGGVWYEDYIVADLEDLVAGTKMSPRAQPLKQKHGCAKKF